MVYIRLHLGLFGEERNSPASNQRLGRPFLHANAARWQTKNSICHAHTPSHRKLRVTHYRYHPMEHANEDAVNISFGSPAQHSSFLHFPSCQIRQHRATSQLRLPRKMTLQVTSPNTAPATKQTSFHSKHPHWLKGANDGFCLVLEQCDPPFEDATSYSGAPSSIVFWGAKCIVPIYFPWKASLTLVKGRFTVEVTRETTWSAWWHKNSTTLQKMKP